MVRTYRGKAAVAAPEFLNDLRDFHRGGTEYGADGGLGIWVQIASFTFPLAQDIFHDMGLFLHAGQALIETLGFKDQLPVVDPEAL